MYLGIFSINDVVYFRATTVNQSGSALDATVGPTFSVYTDSGTTALTTGTMAKVGSKEGSYTGSFTVTSTAFDIGQHFILIEATVDGQTPKATITFQVVSDNLSVEESFTNIQSTLDSLPTVSSGTVAIDHNFGNTDNFRVLVNGTPLADVTIRAFVKSDYDAGRVSNAFVVGQTKTGTDGRWLSVIRLDPAIYTLEFSKSAAYRTSTTNITVA